VLSYEVGETLTSFEYRGPVVIVDCVGGFGTVPRAFHPDTLVAGEVTFGTHDPGARRVNMLEKLNTVQQGGAARILALEPIWAAPSAVVNVLMQGSARWRAFPSSAIWIHTERHATRQLLLLHHIAEVTAFATPRNEVFGI
jgi:hypothetical protein